MRIAALAIVGMSLLGGYVMNPLFSRPPALSTLSARSVRLASPPPRSSRGGGGFFYYGGGGGGDSRSSGRYSSGGGFSSGK